MHKSLIYIFITLFISITGLAEEIGSGSDTSTSGDVSSLDFSNVPPRENVNQCSASALAERQEQQNQCVQRFGEMGLTQVVRPHEVIEAQSCDRIEKFTEYLAGCWSFFADMPGDTVAGLRALFGGARYDQQIQQRCPPSPNYPNVGAGRFTQAQQQQLQTYRQQRQAYDACVNEVRQSVDAQAEVLSSRMSAYRDQCRAEFRQGGVGNQRRLARHGDRPIKGCMIRLAGRDGCQECIDELNQVPVATRLIQSTLNEFKKYRGFGCYNKETQGRMVCAAIATAAGAPLGGTALAGLAARLPAAFRSATAAASGPVARLRAAASATEETADAASTTSSIAAIRAGRVSEETLIRNGGLDDLDRVAAAADLDGIGALSPTQSTAIIRAHEIGLDRAGSGFGNYTQAELLQKRRILAEAGFDSDQIRELMDNGIVGRFPDGASTDLRTAASFTEPVTDSAGYSRPVDAQAARNGMNNEVYFNGQRLNAAYQEGPASFNAVLNNSTEYAQMARQSGVSTSTSELPDLGYVSSSSTVTPGAIRAREYARTYLVDASRRLQTAAPADRARIMEALDQDFQRLGLGSDYLSSESNLRVARGIANTNQPRSQVYIQLLENNAVLTRRQMELQRAVDDYMRNTADGRTYGMERAPTEISRAATEISDLNDTLGRINGMMSQYAP